MLGSTNLVSTLEIANTQIIESAMRTVITVILDSNSGYLTFIVDEHDHPVEFVASITMSDDDINHNPVSIPIGI